LDVALSTRASEATLSAADAKLGTIDADTGQLVSDLQELLTRFGDSIASPTADTLLARMQEIIDQQTDGTQRARVRSSTKGTSTAADVTSRAVDANIEALHVDATHTVQPVYLRDEQHAQQTQFSVFGNLKTVQDDVLEDLRFDAYSLFNLWDIERVNGAEYETVPGGVGAQFSTRSTAGSYIEFLSKNTYNYESGKGLILKISIILGDTGVVGNVREWGLKNAGGDGLFMRMDGTTLKFIHKNRGVETEYDASTFDTPVTVDPNGHTWYIQYPWLGVADFFLYYDNQIVHRFPYYGTSTDFSLGSPDMHVFLRNENVSATSVVTLKSGCASIAVENGRTTSGRSSTGAARTLRVDDLGQTLTRLVNSTGEPATMYSDPGRIELATRDGSLLSVARLMLDELRTIRQQLGHATELGFDNE
jgi:hypothetical protein